MFLANSQSIAVNNLVDLTETLINQVVILNNGKMSLENSIKETDIKLTHVIKLKQNMFKRTKFNFIFINKYYII